MRFEYCILCQELHPSSQIKLKICLPCWEKIKTGLQPTLKKYLELNLAEFFNWEPLNIAQKRHHPPKPTSIKQRVRFHAISQNFK